MSKTKIALRTITLLTLLLSTSTSAKKEITPRREKRKKSIHILRSKRMKWIIPGVISSGLLFLSLKGSLKERAEKTPNLQKQEKRYNDKLPQNHHKKRQKKIGFSYLSPHLHRRSSHQKGTNTPQNKKREIGTLPNIGNSCYWNASMQVIYHFMREEVMENMDQKTYPAIYASFEALFQVLDKKEKASKEQIERFRERLAEKGIWKNDRDMQDADELITKLDDLGKKRNNIEELLPRNVTLQTVVNGSKSTIRTSQISIKPAGREAVSLAEEIKEDINASHTSEPSYRYTVGDKVMFSISRSTQNLETKEMTKVKDAIGLSIQGKVYKLVTFAYHAGNQSDSGHWMAFTYDKSKGKWYKLNDDEYSEISEEKVTEYAEKGTILCYQQV